MSRLRPDLVKSRWECHEFVAKTSRAVQSECRPATKPCIDMLSLLRPKSRGGRMRPPLHWLTHELEKSGMLGVFISAELCRIELDPIIQRREADHSGQLFR